MSADNHSILSEYVQQLIRIKARQLARRPGFTRSDEEDLRQELTLRLLQRARHYDPARASLNTFAERVVCSLVATLLREQRRQKSVALRGTVSLEIQCDCADDGASSLGDLLQDADHARRVGGAPFDPVAELERRDAIRHVLAELPDDLRDVCRRLMRATATEVARDLGVSRHQIQKAIQQLRSRFAAAGVN